MRKGCKRLENLIGRSVKSNQVESGPVEGLGIINPLGEEDSVLPWSLGIHTLRYLFIFALVGFRWGMM